jgi:hypothetical protein
MDGIDRIDAWMSNNQTAPEVRTVITTRLKQWSGNLLMTPIETTTYGLQDALTLQDEIGWDNFFEGRIATRWEQIQNEHYAWCRSRKSGRRWTIALITKLWDVAWDLWEHRIGIVHAKENEEILHGMATVDASIRDHFLRGPNGLPSRLQRLFQGTVDEILKAPIIYRQRWLQRVTIARARAIRRQNDRYSNERHTMYTWLFGHNGT